MRLNTTAFNTEQRSLLPLLPLRRVSVVESSWIRCRAIDAADTPQPTQRSDQRTGFYCPYCEVCTLFHASKEPRAGLKANTKSQVLSIMAAIRNVQHWRTSDPAWRGAGSGLQFHVRPTR